MDPPNSRETATGETRDYLSRMSASPSSKPMNLPVAFGARSSVGDPLGRAEDRVSTKRLLVREAARRRPGRLRIPRRRALLIVRSLTAPGDLGRQAR